ncbi:MAG: hypothetical protein JXA67_15315 [Micromonosporaceae bacterium]|nr:hypothetical protein [Micromonosporaceae bacterium]
MIEAIRGIRGQIRTQGLSPLAGALRPLLPEYADVLPPLLPPIDDRLAERHRVFRALVEVLGSVEALVLVLEDLHWADEQTIDFVRYLLSDPPERLSLVVTFRGEEKAAATVRALTARLPASVTRNHQVLALLDEQETGALASAILGTDRVSAGFAGYLHRWTSGLPFAVEEVLALLRGRGELACRGGGWARRALSWSESLASRRTRGRWLRPLRCSPRRCRWRCWSPPARASHTPRSGRWLRPGCWQSSSGSPGFASGSGTSWLHRPCTTVCRGFAASACTAKPQQHCPFWIHLRLGNWPTTTVTPVRTRNGSRPQNGQQTRRSPSATTTRRCCCWRRCCGTLRWPLASEAGVFLGIPSGSQQMPLETNVRWLYRSLEVLPELKDPSQNVLILGKVAMILVTIGDPMWRELTARMNELTGGTLRQRREVNAYESAGNGACCSGHHRMARELLTAAVEGAAALGLHRLELRVRSNLALLEYCTGRWEGLCARADLVAEELDDYPLGRFGADIVAGCLALAHADLELGAERLQKVTASIRDAGEFDLLPLPVAAFLRLAAACGKAGLAGKAGLILEAAQPVLASVESTGVWPSAARILPPLVAALVAAGQVDRAHRVVAAWEGPLADREVPLGPAMLRHARGILAARAGQWSSAAGHCLAAAGFFDRLECPYEAAQAREQAAEPPPGPSSSMARFSATPGAVASPGSSPGWSGPSRRAPTSST